MFEELRQRCHRLCRLFLHEPMSRIFKNYDSHAASTEARVLATRDRNAPNNIESVLKTLYRRNAALAPLPTVSGLAIISLLQFVESLFV
jgi:hypothetical protein